MKSPLTLLLLTTACLSMSVRLASTQVITREEQQAHPNGQRPEVQLSVPIGPATLTLGGEVRYKLQLENNFDLDQGQGDDVLKTTETAELEGLVHLSEHLELFGELKFAAQQFPIDQAEDRKGGKEYQLGETWIFFRDLFGGRIGLQVGRQDFDDVREWLYDEDLDAIRLFVTLASFRMELAITKQLLDDVSAQERDVVNYLGYASYRVAKRTFIDAYIFLREDHSGMEEASDRDDSDPIWIGIRSYGRLCNGRVHYWFDAAHLTGTSVTVRERKGRFEVTTRDLSAYAVDVGAMYVFVKTPLEPSITLGVAFGSGDTDPDDGADRQFRQTGLQDNTDTFNGVQSFRYYGELFDPELSNLWILTAGVGMKPTHTSSIDFVFHHYWQVERTTRIRNAALDAHPNGKNRDLGSAFDLILGWVFNRRFEAELDVAAFLPGNAFDARADDPAIFVSLELKLNF